MPIVSKSQNPTQSEKYTEWLLRVNGMTQDHLVVAVSTLFEHSETFRNLFLNHSFGLA